MTKLIRCNGRTLQVRDVGSVLVEFRMRNVPIKSRGWEIVEDDEARARVRKIIDSELYERMI